MAERDVSSARGVLICANPFSGSGPNRQTVDGLVNALAAKGFEPRLIWDMQERKAALSDSGLSEWCRCVVVAGGDGSIGAVVNEMCRAGGGGGSGDIRGVALATLPMGNENLFAKHFGFSRDVEHLACAIEAGLTRRVDLGQVTRTDSQAGSCLFTLMAGVGFDAEVVHRMQRWRTSHTELRRVSRISYLPRIISSIWGYRYPRLQVNVDGQEMMGSHLFVFNLPEYGGGLQIAPEDCAVDDGLLDWVLLERPGVLPLARYAISILRGGLLERKDVRHGRSARLTVVSDPHAPVQIDGDPAGVTPVEFRVIEGTKLELLIT